MHHQLHQIHESPTWARAKHIRVSHGLTAPQLIRYAQEGLIRTSHIKRPGQTRGVRLFHLSDIDRLIADSIELQLGRDFVGPNADPAATFIEAERRSDS